MEKTIKLTLKKAKELYGKNKEMDQLLEANFSKKILSHSIIPISKQNTKPSAI